MKKMYEEVVLFQLKSVMPLMDDVAARFVEFLKSYPNNTDFNAKDVRKCFVSIFTFTLLYFYNSFLKNCTISKISTRFTVQNFVRCAFNIDAKCFDKDNYSEFMAIGEEIFTPSLSAGLKFFMTLFLPQWAMELIPVP